MCRERKRKCQRWKRWTKQHFCSIPESALPFYLSPWRKQPKWSRLKGWSHSTAFHILNNFFCLQTWEKSFVCVVQTHRPFLCYQSSYVAWWNTCHVPLYKVICFCEALSNVYWICFWNKIKLLKKTQKVVPLDLLLRRLNETKQMSAESTSLLLEEMCLVKCITSDNLQKYLQEKKVWVYNF